ncbi:MAG TPA: ABC transporter substrate-binding protein [Xanthobacteraceae bacterium]
MAAWPLAARAQKQDRKRLAIVMNLPEQDLEARRGSQAFILKLRELGWLEGRNLDVAFRWVADRVADLPGIAKEIASLKPDAIVGRSGAVALALQHGAGAIPIVFVGVVDPIDVGLGQSLARPGGNITGFMTFDAPMGTKWLEIIKEIAPSLRRVGVLLYPQQSQELILKAIADAVSSFRVEATPLYVRRASEIEPILNTFAAGGDCRLIVLANSVTNSNRQVIVSLAERLRMPAIYFYRTYVEAGGLVSYGIEPTEPFRNAALYVDRIFKGVKPADLPIQAPTKFELIVNIRAAKAIGLTIPESFLLLRADEVIE